MAFPGKLAESNADQVAKVREILEGLSFEVATPEEAREMLQLKEPTKSASKEVIKCQCIDLKATLPT